MRSLAASLQDESLPMALRARILANLVMSGVGGITSLLQQMLKSPKHSVRWLAVLGCGLTGDQSTLDDLAVQLYGGSALVSQAACLALATFDSTRALELLTQALLDANDHVRRAAAEALAMHPEEGHPVLKEGAELEDVNVRRAVVFGLARVKEPWAEEILLSLQTNDDQWVVRNAAIQIIEDLKLDAISIPKVMPPLHETPWLVSYASEKGMGLSRGQGAWDMLANALAEGNEETKMAAMYIYRLKPDEADQVRDTLVSLMRENQGEVGESAYQTLWQLRANRPGLL
jgi:HEAT repeat protein